jgi:hypothetical protein
MGKEVFWNNAEIELINPIVCFWENRSDLWCKAVENAAHKTAYLRGICDGSPLL